MLTEPATGRVEFYNRVLPLAANRARDRDRHAREAGLGAARSVGPAALSRSGDRALVPVLEFVQRVSAPRHRDGQDQASRVQGNAAMAVRARPREAWLGAIRPRSSRHRDQAVHGRRVDDEACRPLLPPVRRAGHRVQRLRNGHLRRRRSARPIHLRAIQSGGVQARRLRSGRGSRQHVRGRARQLVEHRHAMDRRELELRAAHRSASRRIRWRRTDVRRHALRRLSRTGSRRKRGARATSCSPAGCSCPIESRRRLLPLATAFRRAHHRRESAHLLGGAPEPSRRIAHDRSRSAARDPSDPGELRRLQVGTLPHRLELFTRFRLLVSDDGRQWATVADLSRERRDRPNAYVELPTPRSRAVRAIRAHSRWRGQPRRQRHPRIRQRRRLPTGNARWLHGAPRPRRAKCDVHVAARSRAVGYNVRWGISPTKLYQTYQRFADEGTTLELRALTVGQAYWASVESFDENGVSALAPALPIK